VDPFEPTLELISERLLASLGGIRAARSRGLLPHATRPEGGWELLPADGLGYRRPDGTWQNGSWTGGFVAGQLWLAAGRVGDERLAAEARAVTDLLAPRASDATTHDLGFLFWPSAVLGWKATGNSGLRLLALDAARTFARRLTPGGVLQVASPLDDAGLRGWTIVDVLPNLVLLWWAEREGLAEAGEAARSHALRTAEGLVRADGTTYQGARFAAGGGILEHATRQGLETESTWTRGQAWAVYGFAAAYEATGEAWALELAARTWDAFFERLPGDLVPPWDFDADAGPRDSSAGAIACAGALRLDERRREQAERVLDALLHRCLRREPGDGLLERCCINQPLGYGLDCASAWGDFFLVEAVLLAAGHDPGPFSHSCA
jgi:unsaturated chondroitin disaccharide hydrolase